MPNLSPQVITRVEDRSQRVESQGVVASAVVGESEKGSVLRPIPLQNTNDLTRLLGTPNSERYGYAPYCAAQALQGNPLVWFQRVAGDARYAAYAVPKYNALSDVRNGQAVERYNFSFTTSATNNLFTTLLSDDDIVRVTIGDDVHDHTVDTAALPANEVVTTSTSLTITGVGGQFQITLTNSANADGYVEVLHSVQGKTLQELTDISQELLRFKENVVVDTAFIVYAENPGFWGNGASINVTNVNLSDNTFDVEVYLNGNLVNTYTASLESVKNADGQDIQLRASQVTDGEEVIGVINGRSDVIRVFPTSIEGSPLNSKAIKVTVDSANTVSGTFSLGARSLESLDKLIVRPETGDEQVIDLDIVMSEYDRTDIGNVVVNIPDVVEVIVNPSSGTFNLEFPSDPTGTVQVVGTVTGVDRDSLEGGADATRRATSAEISAGWVSLADKNRFRFNTMMAAGYTTNGVINAMRSIAEDRNDCVAIIDPPSNVLEMTTRRALTRWRKETGLNTNSATIYAPWVIVADPFQGVENLTMPPSGFVAGAMGRTLTEAVWLAPAGPRRGTLDSTLIPFQKLTHRYTLEQRNELYARNQINPITTLPAQGTFINGQRNTQIQASKLDRVNVKFLILNVIDNLEPFLQGQLLEQDTPALRDRIEQSAATFLDTLQGGGGLDSYRTEFVEAPDNVLNFNVYLVPTDTVEVIQLTLVVNRSDSPV